MKGEVDMEAGEMCCAGELEYERVVGWRQGCTVG